MIALDTNILVHSHRPEAAHFEAARNLVRSLAEGDEAWALPWPCLYEFCRVVTHARIFRPPSDLATVARAVAALLASPSLVLLSEGTQHLRAMRQMIEEGDARGNLAHDAHIAALALEHGVSELWTLDRDFQRFPGIRTRNPFRHPPPRCREPEADV